MREILFRAKALYDGRWVYGSFVHAGKEYIILPENVERMGGAEFSMGYLVDPETVGQYTGLNDKNGKRIFEGDLVKPYDDEYDKAVIEFHNGRFCVCYYGTLGMQMEYGWDETAGGYGLCECEELQYCEDEEVIGNIHDNPELLEVRND